MALIIVLSLAVLILGLVIYLVCAGLTKGSAGEVGRIMFFAGLLAFLLSGTQIGGCSTTTSGAAVHLR